MHYISYITLHTYTFKLDRHRQTDRQTDRPTDRQIPTAKHPHRKDVRFSVKGFELMREQLAYVLENHGSDSQVEFRTGKSRGGVEAGLRDGQSAGRGDINI